MVNLIRSRFPRVAITLDTDFDPDIARRSAQLGQAFMEVIVNACKSIDRRGEPPAGGPHQHSRAAARWR